jgi:hypothetical protein
MLKAASLATVAFVAIVSVIGAPVYAQVAQGSTVVVDPEASDRRGQLDESRRQSRPVHVADRERSEPRDRAAMRLDRSLQASTSTRSGARARSKARIVAGGIIGGVGGFFAGGFLARTSKEIGATATIQACAAS